MKDRSTAYPIPGGGPISIGLTKREYFSAAIMTGLVVPAIAGSHNTNNTAEIKHKVKMAIELADALIEELNKENDF